MGMEPFVGADAGTFGPLISTIPDPIRNLREALAFKVGLDAKAAEAQSNVAQAAAISQKLNRQQMFQQDLASVQQNPDAKSISALIMKYPEFADQVKSGWDVQDKAAQQADLTQLSEIYSAAAAGHWDTAAKAARARYDADKAAGTADPSDEDFINSLETAATGDDAQKRAVLTTLGTHIAAVTGPEHFSTVFGALKPNLRNVGVGDVVIDENTGKTVAHSPFIKDAEGAIYPWEAVVPGDGSSTGDDGKPAAVAAAMSHMPEVAPVASALASAKLPANVIAGFLGNFHVEGGYAGAAGDGGSATGIAQWRGDRAANFEKVIGKPIAASTPAEQAQFVVWEMQHPEEAGMTSDQRDQIINAKSPAQAASLIDKFYERSSGEHRTKRVQAANEYAGLLSSGVSPNSGGLKPLLPGKQEDSFRLLTPAEKQAQGLDPNTQYQINNKTGAITALGGQQKQAKQIPSTVQTKAQASIEVRDTMARLAGSWNKAYGGHTILGDNLNALQRKLGSWSGAPEGMANWWADFQSMDNLIRNQLFGSALTEHEKEAYKATTISPSMDAGEIVKRFNRRRSIINAVVARQQNFLKKNGYDPEAVDALYAPLGQDSGGRTIVRTGTQKSTGKRIVQYSDGTIEVQ